MFYTGISLGEGFNKCIKNSANCWYWWWFDSELDKVSGVAPNKSCVILTVKLVQTNNGISQWYVNLPSSVCGFTFSTNTFGDAYRVSPQESLIVNKLSTHIGRPIPTITQTHTHDLHESRVCSTRPNSKISTKNHRKSQYFPRTHATPSPVLVNITHCWL